MTNTKIQQKNLLANMGTRSIIITTVTTNGNILWDQEKILQFKVVITINTKYAKKHFPTMVSCSNSIFSLHNKTILSLLKTLFSSLTFSYIGNIEEGGWHWILNYFEPSPLLLESWDPQILSRQNAKNGFSMNAPGESIKIQTIYWQSMTI